jgi:hypothetical protein
VRLSRILPLRGADLALAALVLTAPGCIPESSNLEVVPPAGACQVVVTPGNQATTLAQLNDAAKRVFCVEPGDYRGAGELLLTASGSSTARRYLRFHAPDPVPPALHQAVRAVFESIRIQGSWWVVQGLTLQPANPQTNWFLMIQGGDRNVIDRNLIDGSAQQNAGSQSGILIGSLLSNPATYNSVQSNVVRSGNKSRLPIDYIGVNVSVSVYSGGNNDFNKIVDNEIYDWGDGIALTAGSDCSYLGRPRGTLIDGNDVYVTPAKRADCDTGLPDPLGDCSCAENGIDVKPDPGSSSSYWTRITHNRLWGFRPTASPSCGGSGATGQAITAGNACAGHVFVAGNVILDSSAGISVLGTKWTIVGNLFDEIRVPTGSPVGSGMAILPLTSSGLEVQFNTIVGVDSAYDDSSSSTDTRCNAILDDLAVNGAGATRGSNHSTRYNYLYDAPAANFIGSTNQSFATVGQSRNEDFCFWRRRWTGSEFVCIPFARTTPASPHLAAASSCETNLGSPFGYGPLGFF